MTRSLAVSLAVALLALVGCKTSHPDATNRLGSVRATLAAPPARVTAAAQEVLQEMNIPITSAAATSIDGKVIAESARDKRISVNVELKGQDFSEITIRHGAFGDENISVTILRRIEGKLGLNRTATSPPPANHHTDLK